jgi:hypothetical protein
MIAWWWGWIAFWAGLGLGVWFTIVVLRAWEWAIRARGSDLDERWERDGGDGKLERVVQAARRVD